LKRLIFSWLTCITSDDNWPSMNNYIYLRQNLFYRIDSWKSFRHSFRVGTITVKISDCCKHLLGLWRRYSSYIQSAFYLFTGAKKFCFFPMLLDGRPISPQMINVWEKKVIVWPFFSADKVFSGQMSKQQKCLFL